MAKVCPFVCLFGLGLLCFSKLCFHNLDEKVDVSYSSTSSNHPVHAKYLLPEGWAQTRCVSHLPTKHLALVSAVSFCESVSPLPALMELVTYFQWL